MLEALQVVERGVCRMVVAGEWGRMGRASMGAVAFEFFNRGHLLLSQMIADLCCVFF